MLWMLGPLVGVMVVVGGLRWALRSHRRERAPWLALLSVPAHNAAPQGGLGALDGLALDVGQPPLQAPFTGRACLAYHVEIITQEEFGDSTTWNRIFQDAHGEITLGGPDGAARGTADLSGAEMLFPASLDAYTKLSMVTDASTVFQGSPNQTPAHLVAYVQRLPPEVQHVIVRPSQQLVGGKRLYFNERIVLPGQSVVVAGACQATHNGLHVHPTSQRPVYFRPGTLHDERARIAKLPVAGEAFGAVMGGVIACAVVEMIVAMISK
jgi:hypothetical protein